MNPRIDNEMPHISIVLAILFVLAFFLLLQSAHAQESDIFVSACATQDACTLQTNVPWSVGSRTWRFTAKYPNESIRVWIRNQNTTSAHTGQTVSFFITDDKTASSLLTQADRWVKAATIDNTVSGAGCSSLAANAPTSSPGANGKGTCYAIGMFAVQVAIRITGTSGAVGSPDQFDIGVVQQQSNYPGGPQPGADSSSGGASDSTGVFIGGLVQGTTQLPFIGGNVVPVTNSFSSQDANPNGGAASGGAEFQCLLFGSFSLCQPEFRLMEFNGTTWDRIRSASATNTSTPQSIGALMSEKGGRWSVVSSPAAGTQATASKTAGGGTVRHVADCISFSADAAVAPALTAFTINLRDGATGAGTVIWTYAGAVSATTGQDVQPHSICGLNLIGSANTAMTLEFSTGVANLSESVSFSGYDVQ